MCRNGTKKSRTNSNLASLDFAGFLCPLPSHEFERVQPKEYCCQHIFHSIGLDECEVFNVMNEAAAVNRMD